MYPYADNTDETTKNIFLAKLVPEAVLSWHALYPFCQPTCQLKKRFASRYRIQHYNKHEGNFMSPINAKIIAIKTASCYDHWVPL